MTIISKRIEKRIQKKNGEIINYRYDKENEVIVKK